MSDAASVTVALLGASGSGKSTFLSRALTHRCPSEESPIEGCTHFRVDYPLAVSMGCKLLIYPELPPLSLTVIEPESSAPPQLLEVPSSAAPDSVARYLSDSSAAIVLTDCTSAPSSLDGTFRMLRERASAADPLRLFPVFILQNKGDRVSAPKRTKALLRLQERFGSSHVRLFQLSSLDPNQVSDTLFGVVSALQELGIFQ